MNDTTKYCGGRTCNRPCRGASDCMLRDLPRHEQRKHYLPKIEKLLEAGPTTRETICAELGLNPNTATAYLRHMYKDLRTIRKAATLEDNTVLWELGEDPTLAAMDEDAEAGNAKQHTVTARQMGMARDPLVAGLFGAPGQGAAA